MGDSSRETYLKAHLTAIADEMRNDPTVVFFGQDVRSGVFGPFPVEEFDDQRIRNLPISENAFIGAGVGAAMTGLRPIIDITFATFMYSAMDQIVNQAAKLRYMSGGQAKIPLVITASITYGGSQGAHHADRPMSLFANSPGLKIAVPASTYDVKGLTATAIREDDPVIIFKDASLSGTREIIPGNPYTIPFGNADVKREGTDVTVVAIAGMVRASLQAAEDLRKEGISVEVVDPRTLVPFDFDTVYRSVEKTGRVVLVDPSPLTCSFASELTASIAQDIFGSLKAAPIRVTAADAPTPFSPVLEKATLPNRFNIAQAIRQVASK